MNAEHLLAHFERISEAPDAIARLRRFILDLAVRGKLAEQDPEDEPVEDLLQRIAVEMTSRRSTRARSTPDERVEGWCSIPASWNFVRLDKVCTVIMGSSPPGSTYNKTGDGVPLINGPVEFTPGPFGRTTINQYTTDPSAFCELGDFLVCVRGSTTGRTNIAAFRACIGRGVAAIQPLFEDKFIRIAIRVRQEAILQMGRGIAFPSISREQLSGLPVPLPPLAEQHRIVAKVDELMALCDQLEAARQQREQCRKRLVAATLQRLNQPAEDPASFRKDASFALQVLPSLTTTPAQIKQLRQTILNLAVRGKLVEQDPEDEPAEELLAAITSEKQQAKGSRKASPRSADFVLDGPFGVPTSWQWTQLGAIGDWGSGSTPSRGRSDYYGGAISWFKSGELNDNKCLRGSEEKITHLALEQCSFRLNSPGDVLIAMYGATIGKLAILGEEAVTNQAVCACTPCWGVDTEYLYLFLLAQRDEFRLASEGGAQPNISKVKIVNTLIPLPPLAEQHRIVAKVDELMALFDQLEQQLSQADQQRRRLLEAVLAEALLEPEQALAAMT
jgi:type I restriction enzyme S subunit